MYSNIDNDHLDVVVTIIKSIVDINFIIGYN